MFVATNRIKVKKGSGQQLEGLFRAHSGVEKQPGFLSFEMWRLNRDIEHEEYLVVSHWESEEAHHHWTRSDAFKQAHAGPPPEFILSGEFNSYDVRLSSSPHTTKASV